MPFILPLLILIGPALMSSDLSNAGQVVAEVDRFEAYETGTWPSRWKYFTSKNEIWTLDKVMSERETAVIMEEDGNQFLRSYTDGEALRISLANTPDFALDWDIEEHPVMSWKWRALHLPVGASEKDKNDAGAAVYITFSRDWLGRPRSIKYTYSTTLPVGTVVSFGRLKVIVAASGLDGTGEWKQIERDVAADYHRVFRDEPPSRPLLITLWSDSDDTSDRAEVDIDDILLHSSTPALPLRPSHSN